MDNFFTPVLHTITKYWLILELIIPQVVQYLQLLMVVVVVVV
jgi:hypothetical protein